ncbi:hypothetical protein N7494_012471 [Penicillium frequentans]|uniref:Uncharacterized protein n=1 Tax=Penicillium frequentans TaxID=3151616 RepID=A0AAD6CLS1_9EURO|nr:hypothetical protein N7494_012471 [Penicillium glabrum]
MTHSGSNASFYREQTLANLHFLLGGDIDILTCDGGDSYRRTCKVMQTYGADTGMALKALHDMSCKLLSDVAASRNYLLRPEHIPNCYEVIPIQLNQISDWMSFRASDTPIPLPQKSSETLEAEHDPQTGQEGT